jgi:hypothetical protein
VTATHLLRLKCGCTFYVYQRTAEDAAVHGFECPDHGAQRFKFSRPLKPLELLGLGSTSAKLADPEKRRTPREEALALVEEVFAVRAQKADAEKQYASLKALIERLDANENALVSKLAEEHGLYANPDR